MSLHRSMNLCTFLCRRGFTAGQLYSELAEPEFEQQGGMLAVALPSSPRRPNVTAEIFSRCGLLATLALDTSRSFQALPSSPRGPDVTAEVLSRCGFSATFCVQVSHSFRRCPPRRAPPTSPPRSTVGAHSEGRQRASLLPSSRPLGPFARLLP